MTFNRFSYIDFKYFMNLFKEYTAKPYFFSDRYHFASDNPLHFRNKLLEIK